MTPDARRELFERAERRRTTESMRRQSMTMANHSHRSQRLLSRGLHQMSVSASPMERLEAQVRWSSALHSSIDFTSRTLTSTNIGEGAYRRAESATVWRDEEVMAEADTEAAQLIGGEVALPAADDTANIAGLLGQLRDEPAEDADIAVKFGMYETYQQEVERMRNQVFAFYEENQASLPSAVSQGMMKQIKGIDAHGAMAIPDDTRDWFVFHMMKQAQKNNQVMSKVLEDFGRRLQMLANSDQSQCPVCLEAFGAERRAETLGCCHCVCAECWDHWTGVMHGRPFCPLCRHDEFIDVIAHQADVDVRNMASPRPLRAFSGITERSWLESSSSSRLAGRPTPSRFRSLLTSVSKWFGSCGQVSSLWSRRRA